MKRYINDHISDDLAKKMVFVTGPRQVGKTYLAKSLQANYKHPIYLNYDDTDDAKIIRDRSWSNDTDLIIMDEIHKMKNWKQFLKGTYDTRPEPSRTGCQGRHMLITGSARLDTFRQTGDSLAGRYFHFRLNPLSVKEVAGQMQPYEALDQLNRLGGFPEPFLSGSEDTARRWRKQYYTDLVREDILDFSRIHEHRAIRVLLEMLRRRVGSPISCLSLSRDLQISPHTVRNYLSILEALHIVFSLRPYHANVARAIVKEPKIYFYDSGYVDADEGIRLENNAAVCLLKHVQYLQDIRGEEIDLHYLRTKEKKEIDFVITQPGSTGRQGRKIVRGIEVKLSETDISGHLMYFKSKHPEIEMIQLVHNLKHNQEHNGVTITAAGEWLSRLEA